MFPVKQSPGNRFLRIKVGSLKATNSIEYIDVSRLKLLERNPRHISKERFEKLKSSVESIPKYFEARPCLVNKVNGDLLIYAGNQRFRAAIELGWKKVPCIIETLTEAEQRERTIRDNVELGEWDHDILGNDWDPEELTEWGVPGIDWEPNPPGLTDPDAVPEVLTEPKSRPGDLYKLGNHRLLCGDATKQEDVEKLMGGEKARMTITSPPYENQREYSQWENYGKYLDFILDVINNMLLVSDENFVCLWNIGSSEPTNNFIPADNYRQFLNAGFKWIEWIVWNKESATWTIPRSQHIENGLYIPALRWESICVYLKGNRPHYEISDKSKVREWQENVWNIGKVIGSQQQKIGHPAMFPVEIPHRAVMSYSKLNENIFEPFGGSGTTLIACEKLNRKCYMLEIEPKYVDVIIRRWEDFTGKQAEKINA